MLVPAVRTRARRTAASKAAKAAGSPPPRALPPAPKYTYSAVQGRMASPEDSEYDRKL
jgi:hypothetical protein